jgi:predicted XRE-type DNA-binding protein
MSKNAFADLGFAEDKAAEMALRVAVAVEIVQVIKARDLTQNDAKKLFGVPQPTISKIMKLRLSNLSLAFLLRMLFKASLPFEIRYGGNSQAIDASVAREPSSTAVSAKDWKFDVSNARLDSREVEVLPEPNRSASSLDSKDWPAKAAELVN